VRALRSRLHERAAEVAAIDDVVAALGEGRGNALLIEARAGFGKSALVEYAVETAREFGARILMARARHLESAAPFEVLRRLLGPGVEESGGAGSLTGAARFAATLFTPGADLAQGVDYGCQWLVASLAEQSPLVLAVDDAQWADAASLRVLLEVQAEISVQPVLLVLASRPVENPDAQRRLATMAAQPDCVVLAPGPLTRAGVEAVVAETLGDAAHELFVDDCFMVSGGNAFYLHELLRPYRSDFRPDLQSIVTGGMMSLRRTMSWRLGELGSDAANLAQAAAVLGDGCSLSVAASLAEVDEATSVAEVARLEAASVLSQGDPIEFLHPLIRAAVEETLTEVEVGDLHARAARLLWQLDPTSTAVVPHLVASPGAGDPRVASFLTDRAIEALQTGAIAVAARLLHRALEEPPPVEERDGIRVLIARAEHGLGDLEQAADHLEAALAAADRPVRLSAAVELSEVLMESGRYADLGSLHARVTEMRPYGDGNDEVILRAQLLANAFMGLEPDMPELPKELSQIDASSLPVERDVDRFLLATAAIYERTMRRGTTKRLEANLRRAVVDLPTEAGAMTYWDVQAALLVATFLADDALEEADTLLEQITPSVVSLSGVAPAVQAELDHRRAVSTMRKGNFEDALARVDEAELFTERHGLSGYAGSHRFTRGWVALERGDYAAAGALLRERTGDESVYTALGALLSGEPDQAISVLDEFGFSADLDDPVRPIEVELDPHLVASHAFEYAGDRPRAAAEAERELSIRRTYGPRFRLALALRRNARFATARLSVEMLEEAVALADSTPRRPVRVRVLADLGAALARTGDDNGAREVLYRASDTAMELGMERLYRRTETELRRAGGRPRRTRRTGPTSLTDSQREVGQLAASGLTNREIAERLFVTIKTVETHLGAAYRKLGVSGREALSSALEASATLEHPEPQTVLP
jgi:DNA-binding CsgD family transcriptional regulator